MGIVAAFTDEIVSPLKTAGGQIRQLGQVQSEANDHLQRQAQELVTTFRGLGSSSFIEKVRKQGGFIGNIVDDLSNTAWIFEHAANAIEEAGYVADMALGGGILALAERVLGDSNITPERIMREGSSAISVVIDDMRQNFHKLLDDSGGFFSDLNPFDFHPIGALEHLGGAFGDLIHLGGDIFAMLDSVEQILGRWAADVFMYSTTFISQFQSLIFRLGDWLLGFSNMADDAAILADPNSTSVERAFATFGVAADALGDVLLFIPGAEEGKVAEEGLAAGLREGEKAAEDTAARDLEQQIEATILHDSERAVIQNIDVTIAQDAENTVVRVEITTVEQSLKEDLPAEAEKAVEEELGKGGESFVEKLKNIQDIATKISYGDFITLHPVLRQTLDDGVKQIVDTVSKTVLQGMYGEKAAQKLLDSDVTKKIQELAQDKIKEYYSKILGKPIKDYLDGQANESETEAQIREITKEICQSVR